MNRSHAAGSLLNSSKDSLETIRIIPTDEELMIVHTVCKMPINTKP